MGISIEQWVGSAAVLAATTLIGQALANRIRDRPTNLRRLCSSLRVLQTEIGFRRAPLRDALTRAATAARGTPVGQLFQDAAETLTKPGSTAVDSLVAAVHKHRHACSMEMEDAQVILDLAQSLGATGASDQVASLQASIAMLEAREREALAVRDRFARVYRTLGILAGVVVVILLI
ncbi:stage III sporulation protein AB [Ferroacidibacillus organovorans]|uniref:Stage III sporulation protein AB n=1 Tax=Ferroacidibacillus organovorans TaxID=1765683 RepID=A0A162TAQ5_9BACL|nr:stage III sporulation protein AB [Ferroacidibacillus organovorans]KYP80618.1 hypothetical protein AYJ22_10580 [Ferroacidibacillus organovorans]KYP81027.1 hypothetical protein AYJ22_09265 [Ferroacidibacillus organovorans]OAG94304.1 hypothetical protein AYW79_06115 [Ferroacidibacillus organovorans]OPG16456.1 hypothetical protein B2M26_06145 [Ferroacidibacillus organovorans]